jgi:hypothetical protein
MQIGGDRITARLQAHGMATDVDNNNKSCTPDVTTQHIIQFLLFKCIHEYIMRSKGDGFNVIQLVLVLNYPAPLVKGDVLTPNKDCCASCTSLSNPEALASAFALIL